MVKEDKVQNLLLHLWLAGVEFLSSVEVVLGDVECEMCLLHPADDDCGKITILLVHSKYNDVISSIDISKIA